MTTTKLPTAEWLLRSNFLLIEDGKTCEAPTNLVVKQMVNFAKLHVKAALESAANTPIRGYFNEDYFKRDRKDIDKILNSYPEELIQ